MAPAGSKASAMQALAERLASAKTHTRRAYYRAGAFVVLLVVGYAASKAGMTGTAGATALRGPPAVTEAARRLEDAASGDGGTADCAAGPVGPVVLNGCMTDGANYPEELFSCDDLANGAIILHVIGVLYMFLALSIVCDEYFVPALDVITDKTGVSDDVAGATFMAAGGSAPELFTSFIGVFLAESNVGFGTIVGSAVFNILFVIGMCAVFSTGDLKLTWYPLARDCFFYSLSLLVLVICFTDQKIDWWESAIMFVLYIVYVTAMMNNSKMHAFLLRCFKIKETEGPHGNPVDERDVERQVSFARPMTFRAGALALMLQNVDAMGKGPNTGKDTRLKRAGMLIIANMRDRGRAQVGERVRTPYGEAIVRRYRVESTAPYVVELSHWSLATKRGPTAYLQAVDVHKIGVRGGGGGGSGLAAITGQAVDARHLDEEEAKADAPTSVEDVEAEIEDSAGTLSWPVRRPSETDGALLRRRATFVVLAPLAYPLHYTIPNTQKEEMKPYFVVAFVMSILWIAVFSFLMVWWATQIGDTAGIPPEVMGLTFLAAGTSVPDLLTSVIVAKQGMGDMAVSSSVGSNIFDVTVGLPIPWLIWSLANDLSPVQVCSAGLFTSVVVLFMMLVIVVGVIAISGWVMSTRLGIAMFALYALFVTQNLLTEYGYLGTIG